MTTYTAHPDRLTVLHAEVERRRARLAGDSPRRVERRVVWVDSLLDGDASPERVAIARRLVADAGPLGIHVEVSEPLPAASPISGVRDQILNLLRNETGLVGSDLSAVASLVADDLLGG